MTESEIVSERADDWNPQHVARACSGPRELRSVERAECGGHLAPFEDVVLDAEPNIPGAN